MTMNAFDQDILWSNIMSTIPLQYFRNLLKYRMYITADLYTTTLKTETQGSWADGFAVVGISRSDFDIACPINNCLLISENCQLKIKTLHSVVENPCYVAIEINPQLYNCDFEKKRILTDLIWIKNDKNYLSLKKLRENISTKIRSLSANDSFLRNNVTITSESSINKSNPCFTIQFNLSISKTVEPLQNLNLYFKNICDNIYKHENEINSVVTLIYAYMQIISLCGFKDILNFDIDRFLKEYDWINNIKPESNSFLKEFFQDFKDPIYFENVIRVRNEFIRFSFKFFLYFLKCIKLENLFYEVYTNNNSSYNEILSSKFHLNEFISLKCQTYLNIFINAMSKGILYYENLARKVIKEVEISHKNNKDICISFLYAMDYFAASLSLDSLRNLKHAIEMLKNSDKRNSLCTVIQTLKEFSDVCLQFILRFNDVQIDTNCFQTDAFQVDAKNHFTEIIRKLRGGRLDNVELVPCFKFSGWPQPALSWTSRQRYWPLTCVVDGILNNGFHAVLKASPNGNAEVEARLSFSNAEIILFKNFNFMQEVAFYIFKLIYYLELQTFDTLSTYYIKTITFWVFEQYAPEFWNEESSAAICIVQMLQQLQKVTSSGVLPHYFIPEQNLFASIPTEKLNLVAEKVKLILLNPLLFVKRVGYYINEFVDPYRDDFLEPFFKLRNFYFYSERLMSYLALYVNNL